MTIPDSTAASQLQRACKLSDAPNALYVCLSIHFGDERIRT